MSRRFSILFLLALAAGIYVGTAAEPALLDDADGAHAVAAREILERGDWVVLHMNGVRYLEKAPLHYWLVAGSYAVLGESAFSTRLPLALGVVGLVLMVYAFGRWFFGERAGFYAGLAVCTSLGTFLFTRAMIPEGIYALEFTAAFYLFLRAWTGTISQRAGYWGFAAVVGLAALTRGLVGVIFPAGVVGLFLLLTGGWRRWRELPVVSSALVFLAIAAPWHVIAGLRTPKFFWFYFINEHFLRAIGARHPQDYGTVPLGVWWAAHLVWLFPWSIFLPLALRELVGVVRSLRQGDAGNTTTSDHARLLVFLWAGFILLFFSLTRRMEYYSFGAWPALALLAGQGLARAEEERHRWLPRLQAGLAVVGLLAAMALGTLLWLSRKVPGGGDISRLLELNRADFYRVAMASFFDLTPQAFAALRVPAAGAAISLLTGLSAAWWLRRRAGSGRAASASLALALGMAGFLFSANLAFQAFEPHMSSRPLARELARHLRPEDQIVIYGDFYGGCTLSFYAKRKAWILNGRHNALEFGSYYPDAPRIFLTDREFPAMWRGESAGSGKERVFLFAPQHQRREALVRLPLDATYLVAEIGGKALYVNQPLRPHHPTLAQFAHSQ